MRPLPRTILLGAATVLACVTLGARADDALEDLGQVRATAQAALEEEVVARAAATGATVHVVVNTPDARLKLAACPELSAALPPGARRSGKTIVVVRCLGGRAWQVFLPAEIHVEAPVWVTAHALSVGHALAPEDLTQRTAEVAGEGELQSITVAQGAPIGQTLAHPMPEGVVLRQNDLVDASRVAPGESVNVVYSGVGFSVAGEGKAVGAASPGQSLQVRTAGGTLVTGILRPDRVVEIRS